MPVMLTITISGLPHIDGGVKMTNLKITNEPALKMALEALEALEKVGIAGNHLGLLIPVDHLLHTESTDTALEHYGAGDTYDTWVAWKLCYEAYETHTALKAHIDEIDVEALHDAVKDETDVIGYRTKKTYRNDTLTAAAHLLKGVEGENS